MSEIWLDPLIRDNALLAIFFVSLCVNIVRQNMFVITKQDPKVDKEQMKHNNTLARARLLRSNNGKYLLEEAFRNRRVFYTKKETGVLDKLISEKDKEKTKDGGEDGKSTFEKMESNLMANSDPSAQMGMMKNQIVFVLSQGLQGYWVNYLFHGFLVGKTPFPLARRWRGMLQRGVEVENLEAGYISGLCWYFILMIAIPNIQQLVISFYEGEEQQIDPNSSLDSAMMMMGMAPQQQANPLMGAPDNTKQYKDEKDQLDIYYFESSVLDGIELELWKKWKKDGGIEGHGVGEGGAKS